MKKTKKVFALILAVAMMLSTFTVAFAAEKVQNTKEAQVLHDLGLFHGTSGTSFVPALEANADAYQAIKLIGSAMGWDVNPQATTYFTDVPEWAVPYVAYAAEKGITNGVGNGKFGSAMSLKRFYVWFYRALGYPMENNAWDNPYYLVEADLVDVETAIALAVDSSETVLRDKLVGVMYESLSWKAKDAKTTLLEDLLDAGKADRDAAVAAGLISEETLAVAAVWADNLGEVYVEFNKPIDDDSAKAYANYKINNVTLLQTDVISVLPDGRTVVLNLAGTGARTNQAEYELTVKDVKDLAGNKLSETKIKFTPEDVTFPQVVSVEVTGPKSFKVNFSEPLSTMGSFKVDDGRYYAAPLLSTDKKSVELTIGVKLSTGEHTVTVENSADFYGFKIKKTTMNFYFTEDSSTPSVYVDSTTETKITLKFSKPVKDTGLNTDVTAYYAYNKEAQYKGILTKINPDAKGYTDTYTITFGQPIPQGFHTLYLNTKTDKLQDKWGNDVDSLEIPFSITVDNVAPTVTSVVAEKDNKIVVSFSEDLNSNDAVKKAYYTLKDTNGEVITTTDFADVDSKGHFNSNASLSYDSDADTVTINLTTSLPGSTYYLTIDEIRDSSYKKNVMDETMIGFAVSDTTGPSLSSAIVNSDGSKIRVTFDEPMSAVNLTDTDNYRLIVNGSSSIPLPTNSSVTIINSKTVEISLGTPDSNIDNVGDKVQVGGDLTDISGNAIGGFFKEVAVTNDGINVITDTAGDKVYITAKNTLEVKVDKELKAIDAQDIKVNSGNVASAYYTNDSGKSTVTVILNSDLKTDGSDLTEVRLNAGAITNIFGTDNSLIVLNVTSTFADKIVPEVTKAEAIDTTHIRLTFSEEMDTTTVSKYTFRVADNTVTAISWNNPLNTQLTLTLEDQMATDATPDVTQVYDAEDRPGNVLPAGTDVPSTADLMVPTAISVSIESDNSDPTKAVTNDVVTITVETSEPYTNPVVTIDGNNANITQVDPTRFKATYTTQAGDTQGVLTFTVDFDDSEGRAATQVTATTDSSSVTFNNGIAPAASSVSIASNNANTAYAKVGDTVTITVDTNEAYANPAVTIDGNNALISVVDADTFTAAYTTQAGDTEGVLIFAIDFEDLTSNAATQITSTTNASSVRFDESVPNASTVSIASNNANTAYAKVGDTVTITVDTNEVYTNASATIDGKAAVINVVDADTFTATYVTQTGDTVGALTFTVDFNDLAGNSAAQVIAVTDASSVTFDETIPTASTVSIASNNANTAYAKVGDTVTITVDTNEAYANAAATIDGKAATINVVDADTFTATYVTQIGDTDGVLTFAVDFTDLAGNPAAQVIAVTDASSVTFDEILAVIDDNNVDTIYNEATGELVVKITEANLTGGSIDVTKFTIKDGAETRTLTNLVSSGVITDNTTITITVAGADKAAIDAFNGSAPAVDGLDVAAGGVTDIAGNSNAEDLNNTVN